MLFLTSKIHKELIGEKNQIFSALILSTTFLWINFFHMATQDIIFSTIVTFGIFSTIKASKTKKPFFIFFSGIWIGLAVMLKTYLTAIPLLAILPFLIKTKIIKNKLFWLGTLLGFFPFFIWSYNILTMDITPSLACIPNYFLCQKIIITFTTNLFIIIYGTYLLILFLGLYSQ